MSALWEELFVAALSGAAGMVNRQGGWSNDTENVIVNRAEAIANKAEALVLARRRGEEAGK